MSKESASSCPTFWLDEDKGRKLALLQDRVSAVGDFLERCRHRFANIYKAMFPLNPPAESFGDLMKKFGSMAAIHSLLRAQITAGAQLGLTFVRVRHPDLDMDAVSRLPFKTQDPQESIDLQPHLSATEPAAKVIVRTILAEEESLVYPRAGNFHLLPAKEEPL